ncbi:MAG: FecR family protein [Chitinophagaceae bacterium]|nr:MAG: FecR family protein [Chitinophagaceae bacterium]
MDNNQVKILLQRYRLGLCTEEEIGAIEQWYNDLVNNNDVKLPSRELAQLDEEIKAVVFEAVKNEKEQLTPVNKKINYLRYAAAILALASIGALLFFLLPRKNLDDNMSNRAVAAIDALPGGDKAILTLGNGTTISLDSAKNGFLAEQGATNILKVNTGQIAYSANAGDQEPALSNTVTTPKAGQYSIILPDGTKVWLNASSSLQFPSKFDGLQRRVTLTGEGYFEVQHDDQKPFIVQANTTEIHDLGTAFNINAYNDEPTLQVTLVEGSANVKTGVAELILEPGTAATVKNNQMSKETADVTTALAWKNGIFQFNKASLESVMRQIARWYDLDIEYQATSNQLFSGSIYRNSKASEIFKILEENDNNIHFTINEKKIIVHK